MLARGFVDMCFPSIASASLSNLYLDKGWQTAQRRFLLFDQSCKNTPMQAWKSVLRRFFHD